MMATNRGGSITPNFPKGFLWKICAALLCYPFQILKTNRGGSIAPNFLKGFLSENLVLSNRCDAVLSISNTENKQGRFDSTKFSEGFFFQKIWCYRTAALLCYPWRFDSTKFSEAFSFRKVGAIELLRCCVIRCCVIHGGSKAPKFRKGCLSENLVLSNRCAAVLSIANDGKKQGLFDNTNFSEGFPFRTFGAIEPLRYCVIHCKY